jgi:hypothetical protein
MAISIGETRFVIEVNLWSEAFSSRGNYYDPFTQVRWAERVFTFF